MSDQLQHNPQLVKLFTQAISCQSRGDKNGALIAYKRAQRQFPDFVDAWTNASVMLFEMGRAEEALDMALRAVELDAENASAYCALANAYQSLGRFDDAVVNFRKAIEHDPAPFPAFTNLAGIYSRAGNFAEALELDDRAIQSQPSHSVLWGNRGHTKMRALDMAGAEADLKRALELDADNALARWNLAYIQLLQQRYCEAWPNFKARQYLSEWSGNRQNFGKPHWNGEPLNGRALLVYTEQGFGDTLHFARFIPRLKHYGGTILLLTYRPLERLLSGLQGIDGLIIEGEPLPNFDLVVPLMELPVIFNAGSSGSLDLTPLPPPSLPECQPIPELVRPGFKIGLVWAGSPAHTNDALRSMNPRLLDTLADIPDIAWYGLQKTYATDPPNLPGFIDMSPHMGDFMDTAQIVRQLDLIITVDTSMAHLVGFLGLPAIVLLTYMPDWRWGLDEHTPWYPTLKLLRQSAHNDWKGTVSLLKQWVNEFLLQSVIQRDPKHPLALTNLAGIYANRGNMAGALELHDRAVQALPSLSILWGRRGHTKMLVLDMAGAEADLKQALQLEPNNEKTQLDLVHVLLRQHRYLEVWPYFKARQRLVDCFVNSKEFGKFYWKGEHLNGRTVLVYSGKGFGDTIQFARFLTQIQQQYDGRVMLSVFE
ncbi:MAG: tetratricopeptide repeat protein, partial [Holophagales bacterium]|nr:tetratricopeptide repeat protein [Holophagales bacterium]